MTKEMQKNEALKRMKALKLDSHVIDDFKKSGRVYYSERQNAVLDGILYWCDNNKRYVDLIQKFEKKYGALVYHCQLSHTCFGDLFAMLYVSAQKDEWAYDNDDLKYGTPIANVINLSDESMSDFGSIQVAPKNGGITRLA